MAEICYQIEKSREEAVLYSEKLPRLLLGQPLNRPRSIGCESFKAPGCVDDLYVVMFAIKEQLMAPRVTNKYCPANCNGAIRRSNDIFHPAKSAAYRICLLCVVNCEPMSTPPEPPYKESRNLSKKN